MKTKIGAITIGQSPRVDVTADILPLLPEQLILVEAGALDAFTVNDLWKVAPERGPVLVSRMRDGLQVRMDETKILIYLQKCITELEAQGCQAIVMLCTGDFPAFTHKVPLLKPRQILQSVTKEVIGNGPIGLIVPDEAQAEHIQGWWVEQGIDTQVAVGSPYLGMAGIEDAAHQLANQDLQLIIADCIGYTVAMKERIREITGIPVILPRTLIARILTEIYA